MRFCACGKTDVGLRRETNEDRLLVDTALGLMAIADGMGGHAAGEVAAELAVHGVFEYFHDRRSRLEQMRYHPDSHRICRGLLVAAVNEVCDEIHSLSRFSQHCRGMGTTLTAVLMMDTKAIITHVGDSRLYLMRAGAIRQITQDHTLAAELTRKGLETHEVSSHLRFSHMLVRAIGQEPPLELETHVLDILPHDTLLLCTDGLSNYFPDPREFVPFLIEGDCDQAACRLIDYAIERGGDDNASVIVASMSPVENPLYGLFSTEPICGK